MIDSERGEKKKQSRLAEKELINLVATVVNEKGKENPSLWTRSWRPLGLVQILGGLNIVSKHDVYFPFSFQVPKHMYIDINEKILFLFLLRLLHHIFLYIYCFFFFLFLLMVRFAARPWACTRGSGPPGSTNFSNRKI